MGIQSFLQAEKGDPDWLFSPEYYFGKQFKLLDANTIELKEGRKDNIVLRLSPDEKGLLAKHLRVDVRENATLDLTILNESSPGLQQVFIYDIKLREGASLNLGIFAKGGKFNKHIFQVDQGDGSTFASFGLVENHDKGASEIISKVYQQGSESLCTQFIGAIAGPDSQTAYQGMVIVHRDSQGSETGLESMNLITGAGGRCYSRPDVTNENPTTKVRYGSQHTCIDSNMALYLASKGLDAVKSQNILIKGFQKQIFNLIREEDIREEVEQMFNSAE
jgi:Fe-S cluster assembly scaffold protein SufB